MHFAFGWLALVIILGWGFGERGGVVWVVAVLAVAAFVLAYLGSRLLPRFSWLWGLLDAGPALLFSLLALGEPSAFGLWIQNGLALLVAGALGGYFGKPDTAPTLLDVGGMLEDRRERARGLPS